MNAGLTSNELKKLEELLFIKANSIQKAKISDKLEEQMLDEQLNKQ